MNLSFDQGGSAPADGGSGYHHAVRRLALQIITAIQLTRLTVAFGAVSDLWFIILLTRAEPAYDFLPVHMMPLPLALFIGLVVASGLYAYGASLNDVLDMRHDRAFQPQRPLPAGRIQLGQAAVVTVGSLIIAILASVAFDMGAVFLTLVVAAGLLFYNATGKYIPAVGVVTLGLIHAAHMFIPNIVLEFTLPVWLVMTHAMVIAAVVHVLEDKRPRITRRTIAILLFGWLSWSAVVLGLGWMRAGALLPEAVSLLDLLYPAVAVVGFIIVALWKASEVESDAAAEKLRRYGAMWQSLYGATWLLALGLHAQAIGIALFALFGFAAMTAIKEITGLTGEPVTYR